jgi:hypothetical protein
MKEIDRRALNAHAERVFARRIEEIDRLRKPSPNGEVVVPTIEKRFEWLRGYLDRLDYECAVFEADKILAMSLTDPQRAEAARLRARAERAARAFGASLAKPPPVEPTWR